MTTLGEAILYLSGDDSKLVGSLNAAQAKAKGWATSVGSAVSTLAGGAIVAGVGAAAAGFVALGTAGFKASSDIRQSQNDLIAALGLTEAQAERLGKVGVEVFKNNFGGSISEATAAVGEARKQLGDLSEGELQDATENAFRLQDAFGTDLSESLNAANVLMNEFGLTQQQAFDFLASGFQQGLNSSGDFLDSIGEYGNLFGDAGFGAEEFFSTLQQGLEGGVLGTDKIADAVKEFQIRFTEGGKDVQTAIQQITGDSWQMFIDEIKSGDSTVAEVMNNVVQQLAQIEDPIERNRLQVALFGTQAEDLGVSFTDGLDEVSTTLEEMAGSIDKVDAKYNNLGAAFEGVKRRVVIAITPITDLLLDWANQVMPQVVGSLDWFEQFITNTAVPALRSFGAWFMDEGWPAIVAFTTPIIEQLVPGLQLLGEIALNVATAVMPYLSQAFTWLSENMNIVLPILAVIGAAVLAVASPITFLTGLVVLLATAWANNWGGIQEKTQAVIDFVTPYIEAGMAAIQSVVEVVLSYLTDWWQAHGDSLVTIVNFVWGWIQSYIGFQIRAVQAVIVAIAGQIRAFWDQWGATILEIAQIWWEAIKENIKLYLDLIGFILDAWVALIEGDWDALGEALQAIWDTLWQMVENTTRAAKDVVVSVVKNLWSNLQEAFDSISSSLREIWETLWQKVKDATQAATDAVVSKAKELVNNFKDAFNGFAKSIVDNFERLKDGAEKAMKGFYEAVMEYVNPVVNAFSKIKKAIQDAIDAFWEWAGLDAKDEDFSSGRPSAKSTGGGVSGSSVTNNYFNQTNNSPSASAARDFQMMSLELGFR